ncbi:MAG: CBS domain-containing protein [Spirochaetes bacterium]|nr:CBS domain-containing protein [Spirochaetota bacterium]
MSEEILRLKKVGDIKDFIVKSVSMITADKSIDQLLTKMTEDLRTRHVYVIDEKKRLIGSVRLNDVLEFLFPYTAIQPTESPLYKAKQAYEVSIVKDIMNPTPYYVYEDTYISDMVKIMEREKINELPVVNKNREVVGEIILLEVIEYYLKEKGIKKTD